MRKFVVLCVAVLCLSGAVLAQNDPTAPVATTQPMSVTLSGGQGGHRGGGDGGNWQVGMNYTYQRYDISGNNNGLQGFHTTVSKYLGDSNWGLEGAVSASWGAINPLTKEHLVFYGGGLRISARDRRVQPWVHALVGGAHVRLTQAIGPAAFNGFAFEVGGGLDWRLSGHWALRMQVDYLATRIGGAWQHGINAGAGLVVSF
jgi:opacity protein-like surface antigen